MANKNCIKGHEQPGFRPFNGPNEKHKIINAEGNGDVAAIEHFKNS